MYKLIKSAKYKVVLGATVGSLVTGGITTALNNYGKSNTASITYPFLLDDIDNYGVTTQKYYLKELDNKEYEIIKDTPIKKYMDPKDIYIEQVGYFTNGKSSLSLSVFIPTEEPVSSNELQVSLAEKNITEYSCYFYIDDLTEEELEQKIAMFKNGQVKELLDSVPENQRNKRTLSLKEIETNIYIAELTITTIDYKDIKVTKESKENNDFETCFSLAGMISGAQLGGLIGYALDIEERLNKSDDRKEKQKVRKRSNKN